MSLKLDLHIHSESHGVIYLEPNTIRKACKANKIDGLAITNFSQIEHAKWLKKRIDDYIIIVGQEINTELGHIIGLGLKEAVNDFQSTADTIDQIHDQGGFVFAPHPFLGSGIGNKALFLNIDAIEVYNSVIAPSYIFNLFAYRAAKKYQLPAIASSDTMAWEYIGSGVTEVIVNSVDMIFDGIKQKKTVLHKKRIPLPLRFILENLLYYDNI